MRLPLQSQVVNIFELSKEIRAEDPQSVRVVYCSLHTDDSAAVLCVCNAVTTGLPLITARASRCSLFTCRLRRCCRRWLSSQSALVAGTGGAAEAAGTGTAAGTAAAGAVPRTEDQQDRHRRRAGDDDGDCCCYPQHEEQWHSRTAEDSTNNTTQATASLCGGR